MAEAANASGAEKEAAIFQTRNAAVWTALQAACPQAAALLAEAMDLMSASMYFGNDASYADLVLASVSECLVSIMNGESPGMNFA